MTPEEILGVKTGASREENKRAFRRFVRRHHPDRGGDPRTFRAGVEAYAALSGPRRVPSTEVVFYHRPRGLGVLRAWWQGRRRRPRAA